MTNPEHPAFPNPCAPTGDCLTKREYFAAKAMQGAIASSDAESFSMVKIARYSVEQADALIAALNEELVP